ncbi:response regulator [Alteromonas sp. CYL-A6]|uniref:response regulator n=1 Tax=Alteromonas nitratireducens TaxID=3390813 RepID=UPI0034C24460
MAILSVEDNEINQLMLTERLKLRGYDVISVSGGQAALAVLSERNDIELMLLDIGLPDIDGTEVAKRVRATESAQTLPIIFLSAHSTEEFKEIAQGIAGCDFIPKPVDFDLLFERIGTITG